ncbi:MAG TPA: hypothetical protein VF607_03365, partial [Verrucomicrobiae bacterium]
CLAVFTLATSLAPTVGGWTGNSNTQNFFAVMFGDGRKLFANQFFTMADVYFHSGYYPSIFDKKAEEQKEIIAASRGHKESEEEEKNEDFLGKPKDWIEAFGRNFKITQHTHLEGNNEREILPWLRLAADLDPQKAETYTVGAYFLRLHLGRTDQAEAFLREGLRNNPASIEIMFELGRIYHDAMHDPERARCVWRMAANAYPHETEEQAKDNKITYEAVVVNLAHLEEETGNYQAALDWFHLAQKVSPAPDAMQAQIDLIRQKISAKQP